MHFLRDKVTKLILELGFKFNIEITATFIPSKVNRNADMQSRIYRNARVEWSLHESTMQLVKSNGWKYDIDLFASHLNKKHDRFVSWYSDPYSFS